MGFELVIDHLVDLLLQKIGLLLIKCWIFLKWSAQCFFGNLEVVFDYYEWVLQYVLQYLHLLFYSQKLFFRVSICSSGSPDFLFEIGLSGYEFTMRFLIGI